MVKLKDKGNTKVYELDNKHVVRLYSTNIVGWDGQAIMLHSGGYQTVTTKQRMNQAASEYGLGYTVYSKNGQWYVSYKDVELEFYDGITLMR